MFKLNKLNNHTSVHSTFSGAEDEYALDTQGTTKTRSIL